MAKRKSDSDERLRYLAKTKRIEMESFKAQQVGFLLRTEALENIYNLIMKLDKNKRYSNDVTTLRKVYDLPVKETV